MDNSWQKSKTVNVGDTLNDRYHLTELIGRGGCGLVFRATDLNLQRDVAIKVLSGEGITEHDMLKRFEQESQILRRLRSANTVYFYDCGETIYHQPYIVMEFVTGQQLKHVLENEKKLSPKRTVAILTQVLSALSEAHQFGFIHRDLKPSNIMLCKRPGFPDDFVKVLDFGIAKVMSDDENGTSRPDVAGTPRYMPPEQFKNEPLSPASDLYSIGCIAYEMLTGVAPFDGDSLHVIVAKHLFMTPPPMGQEFDIYPNLVSVVFKLLEKKPSSRFATAQEIIHVLEHWNEPSLIPEMLDYAVPVAEEEFSLEESLETIPLQLPPDFARRLANMPMSGPIAIDEEATMGGLSASQELLPITPTSLEDEDSAEATRFDVPAMPLNQNTNTNRLHYVTSQLKAYILLNDYNHGQKKYLAIASGITLLLLIAVIVVIIVKAVRTDNTNVQNEEIIATVDSNQTDNTKSSDDTKESDKQEPSENDSTENTEKVDSDKDNNDGIKDDDIKTPDSNSQENNADSVKDTDSAKDNDKKDSNNSPQSDDKEKDQYPLFTFTLTYSPINAKVSFTNAEGTCSKGKCTVKTTSTSKPASIVVSANGYDKQRIVIKKETQSYNVKLKKIAKKPQPKTKTPASKAPARNPF